MSEWQKRGDTKSKRELTLQPDLGVILHGSVHHHQVCQEGPQVRDRPLHHSLFAEEQPVRNRHHDNILPLDGANGSNFLYACSLLF